MRNLYDYQGNQEWLEQYFETPFAHGAVADGITDDTNAIKSAIEANKGKTLFFPAGTYAISEPITTYPSDENFTNLIFHPEAVILPTVIMDYVLDIGGKAETFTRAVGTRKKYVSGGKIRADVGNVTIAAVHVDNDTYDVDLSNMKINTLNCAGIALGESGASKKSTDCYIHHVIIKHSAASNTAVGIIVYSNDNSISDSRIYYNKIGMQFYGGSTYVNNVHTLANGLQTDSISFNVIGTDIHISNSYGDSENTFMKLDMNDSSVPQVSIAN